MNYLQLFETHKDRIQIQSLDRDTLGFSATKNGLAKVSFTTSLHNARSHVTHKAMFSVNGPNDLSAFVVWVPKRLLEDGGKDMPSVRIEWEEYHNDYISKDHDYLMVSTGKRSRIVPPGKYWINKRTPVGEDADIWEYMPHGGKRLISVKSITKVGRLKIFETVEDTVCCFI